EGVNQFDAPVPVAPRRRSLYILPHAPPLLFAVRSAPSRARRPPRPAAPLPPYPGAHAGAQPDHAARAVRGAHRHPLRGRRQARHRARRDRVRGRGRRRRRPARAPAGAITVLLPIYIEFLGLPKLAVVAPVTLVYTLIIAFLMVSKLPVYSGKKMGTRVPPDMVLPVFVVVVLFFALLLSYPWEVLT